MLIVHLVPDVFDQDVLPEGRCQGKQCLDLLATAPVDLLGRSVVPLANDDQHTAAAGCVRNANAMLDIGTRPRARSSSFALVSRWFQCA